MKEEYILLKTQFDKLAVGYEEINLKKVLEEKNKIFTTRTLKGELEDAHNRLNRYM